MNRLLKKGKTIERDGKVAELDELAEHLDVTGMKKAAANVRLKRYEYKRISEDSIKEFVVQLAGEEIYNCAAWDEGEQGPLQFSCERVHFCEESLERYSNAPPIEILKALRVHQDRNIFDYFTVAWVEMKEPINDPLIFGRFNDSEDRYFVAQWGGDLPLDDLL